MLSITNADALLKSYYLDAITDQLNTATSPFYNMIKKGSDDIVGKNVLCPIAPRINNNVYMTSETDELPSLIDNTYLTLKAELKNIYGKVEISDKTLRASERGSAALVNALGVEMQSLLDSAKFHFERALMGTGTGVLAKIKNLTATAPKYNVDTTARLHVGMSVKAYYELGGAYVERASSPYTIKAIDRESGTVTLSSSVSNMAVGDALILSGNFDKELNGVNYVFDNPSNSYFGVSTTAHPYLKGTKKTVETLTLDAIQDAVDMSDIVSGRQPDLIMCSFDVRKKYRALIASKGVNVDFLNLDGGFKALSYNGIPVVASKFIDDGEMMVLNTADFKLCQLNDWDWIQGGVEGSVLHQIPDRAAYSATLVKYANLVCTRPAAQYKLVGITA